jgi:archaellin
MLPKYWFKLDLRGEVGVATTLVITSLLLVSGAAATTVIETNNDYQQQAESTAAQAIADVSTGITVIDVLGHLNNGAITSLDILIRLNPGSPVINLEGMTIVVTTTIDSKMFIMNATDPQYRFTASQVNIASGLAKWTDNMNHTVGSGDLIKVTITGIEIKPGQSAKVNFIPSVGQETFVQLNVPDAMVGSVVTLR